MELAPELSTTYSAAGRIKYKFDHDFEGAFASLEKAIEKDPEDSEVLVEYAWTLLLPSRPDAALEKGSKTRNITLDSVMTKLAVTARFKG